MTKLEKALMGDIAVYLMHWGDGDGEGMDLAMQNIVETIEKESPMAGKMFKESDKWIKKCPQCQDYWQSVGGERGRVVISGDCGHHWDALTGKEVKN